MNKGSDQLARLAVLACSIIPLLCSLQARAQPFSFDLRRTDLADAKFGRVMPADVDADGDMDLVVSGVAELNAIRPSLYEASAGPGSVDGLQIRYAQSELAIPLWLGAGEWNDANRDGRLDLLVTGLPGMKPGSIGTPAVPRTVLYLAGSDGALRPVDSGLPDRYGGEVAWADVDRDGDPDVLLTGLDAAGEPCTDVFINDGRGRFSGMEAGLPRVSLGDASWADLDGDGDLDLALSGIDALGGFHTVIARNDAPGFTVTQVLESLAYAALDWGDYDADGDPDLILAGGRLSPSYGMAGSSILYRNDGGVLSSVPAALPGVFYGGARWGDFDQDGDLDLALTGIRTLMDSPIAAVFENQEGGFRPLAMLPGAYGGSLQVADLDNDDDLDLILSGQDASSIGFVRVVANISRITNHPPTAPEGLSTSVRGTSVTLSWLPAQDAATPVAALTYSVRVGTASGISDVLPALSTPLDGVRTVYTPGNVGARTTLTLSNLPTGSYFWSVQAIDTSLRGSAFAAEAEFVVAGGKTEATADASLDLPRQFRVVSVYPNPFSSITTIAVELPDAVRTTVSVFDVSGRRISTVVDTILPAGQQEISWNGRGGDGSVLPPGVYALAVQAGSSRVIRFVVHAR